MIGVVVWSGLLAAVATPPACAGVPTPTPVGPPSATPLETPSPSPSPSPTPLPPRPAVAPWATGLAKPVAGSGIASVGLIAAGRRNTIARFDGDASARRLVSRFASVSAAGGVGPLHTPKRELIGNPVFDDAGHGYALVDLPGSALGWATMDTRGVLGPAHRLGRALSGSRIDVDRDGNLAIAWLDQNTPLEDRETGGVRYRLRVALRPAGGAFRKKETLPLDPTLDAFDPTVSVGARGRVVVAIPESSLTRATGVTAWTGTVRSGLGSRQSAGAHASRASVVSAITPEGMAVLAWGNQSVGEEVSSGWRVRAAALTPGSARWGAMRELDPGGPKVEYDSGIAIHPDGRGGVLLGWTNLRDDGNDVSTATVDRSGRISARQTIAPDAYADGFAVADDGAAIVTWFDQPTQSIRASYRPPGRKSFGRPEALPSTGSDSGQPFFLSGRRLVIPDLEPSAAGRGAVSLALHPRAR